MTLESLAAEVARQGADLTQLRADGDSWLSGVQVESARLHDWVTSGVAQIEAECDAMLASVKGELQMLFQEIKGEFDQQRAALQGVTDRWSANQGQGQQDLQILAQETSRHVDSLLQRVQGLENSGSPGNGNGRGSQGQPGVNPGDTLGRATSAWATNVGADRRKGFLPEKKTVPKSRNQGMAELDRRHGRLLRRSSTGDAGALEGLQEKGGACRRGMGEEANR